MQEIKAIIRTDRLQDVIQALHALPSLPGVTVSTVRGFGKRASGTGAAEYDQTDFTKQDLRHARASSHQDSGLSDGA